MTVDSFTCISDTHIYASSLVLQTGYMRNCVSVFSYIRMIHVGWVYRRKISIREKFVWGKKKRYLFRYTNLLGEDIFDRMMKSGNVFFSLI
jgi:hypothetical protein